MLLFAETFNKEVSNVLCQKSIILVELLFELRIVVIQDSEDGKRTACKKCARKIVNCYRMFTELQRRPSTKRVLFSDQYSELEDEITSPVSRSARRTSFHLTGWLSRHNFCSLFFISLIPGNNCRATSRVVLKSSLSMIT